ncbi:PepSY-like domain-containing protein [Capnocytophaga canimorsus]|uniref:PepSY-like domain-containing protein n=1 Tax=Capnocytophaga canimorsus TaxID=28188 RepID=UPI0037D97A76
MKKMFLNLFVVALASSLMAFSCDKDDDVIPFGNLPVEAKNFINQFFPNVKVTKTELKNNGFEVDLANGVEIDFDQAGNWVNVDARDRQALPNTDFIPQFIVNDVKVNYPNNPINGIEKKGTFYEVELVGIEKDLIFSEQGQGNPNLGNTLPQSVKEFTNQYFKNIQIVKSEIKTNTIEVDLANGVEIDFDKQGNWIDVDARDGQALPNTNFIAQSIIDYVKTKHPNHPINGIEKKANGYEVELVGIKEELVFNTNGGFVNLIQGEAFPESVTAFVSEFFPNVQKVKSEIKTNGFEIDLANGVEIDFDKQGNWINVDARDGQALPNTAFLLASIVDYVQKNYPNNPINGVEKKLTNYEVELVSFPKDLYFNANGAFIGLEK